MNKTSVICKDAIPQAFDSLGGVEGLVAWAKRSNDNRMAFYTRIWQKLLPIQVPVDQKKPNVAFNSYEEMRDDMIRRGIAVPTRLAPPPSGIDREPRSN